MKLIKVLAILYLFIFLPKHVDAAITQGTFSGLTPHSHGYACLANDAIGNTYFLLQETSSNFELWKYDGSSWSSNPAHFLSPALVNSDPDVSNVTTLNQYMDIATDGNNNLHAVLRFSNSSAENGLLYGFFNGTSWDFDIILVNSTSFKETPQIVIDDNNYPHVVFRHISSSGGNTTFAIKHTHRKTGSWSVPSDAFSWTGPSGSSGSNQLDNIKVYVNSNNLHVYNSYENNVNTSYDIRYNVYNNTTDTWDGNILLFDGVTGGDYYGIGGRYIQGANSYFVYQFTPSNFLSNTTYFQINNNAPITVPAKAGRVDFPEHMERDANGNYYMLTLSYTSNWSSAYYYMLGYNGNTWTGCDQITELDVFNLGADGHEYTVRPDGKIVFVYYDYDGSAPYGTTNWIIGEIADFMPSNCFTPQGAATPPTMGNTVAVSNITATTATSGGNITNDNGDAVTVSGVCWNTSTAPTTANSKSTDGDNAGTFTSNLTGLSSNTLYYVRSYATNAGGSGYGTEVTFTTLALVPNAPTVDNASATTLDVTLDVNGNNASTTFAIQETSTGDYVQANGSLGASAVWQDNATWGTVTVTGLTRYTEYTFQVKARNSDNVETAFGTAQSGTTLQTAPTLTTNAYSNLSANNATSGGEITDDGGANVTVRGVCWNTTGTPDINDSKTTDGTGSGSFTSDITGLTPNTQYYVRSYATNSVGTSYGDQIQFTTLNISVTITNVIKNTDTEYEISADISNPSSIPILAKGYVWSTSQNPTIISNSGSTSNGTGDASFTDNATISIGPGYYVKAYITTAGGTYYSDEIHFGVVPTLPEWGLIFLAAGFVLGGGWFAFRRIL